MPYPPPKELLEYLRFYDESVEQLALQTRAFVLQQMVPCVEFIVDATNAVAMGYGPTDRLKDGVCHVAVYAKYVNIGLNHGVELDNSSSLLEGSGNQIRHITIRKAADLKDAGVKKILREAHKLACMKENTKDLKGLTTVIKRPYPRKRRPYPAGRPLRAASSAR
jgi:hypothetical protein